MVTMMMIVIVIISIKLNYIYFIAVLHILIEKH